MIRIFIGFFIVLGTVGNQDFWDECYAAADCVAGDPPSLVGSIIWLLVGIGLMLWGAWSNRDQFDTLWINELPPQFRPNKDDFKNKKF